MTDADSPKFPLSKVADAAGIPVNTLRSWYQRGHFTLSRNDGDKRAKVHGLPHLLSFRSAVLIGIAAELYRLGMHPAKGIKAARNFAEISDPLDAPGYARDPGELFKGAITALIVYPGDIPNIVPITDKLLALELLSPRGAASMQTRLVNSFAVVRIDRVHERMAAALEGIE